MPHSAIEQTLSINRFFFPIHIYEVAIRNAISDAVSNRYGQDWPTNSVFQNSLNYSDKNSLLSAISGNYQGVGKLLPELKFVWFENMLTRRHDGRIWKPYITKIFSHAPTEMKAKEVRKELKDACYIIRKFRNRCGHHEPVFNNSTLHDVYPLIVKSLDWRCDQTSTWMDKNQSVTSLLAKPVI